MSKSVIAILGIVVVIGIGWYLWNTGALTPSPAEAPATTEQKPVEVSEPDEMNEVVVNLVEQNASGESGTATITEVEGGVRVVLNLIGASEGVVQPAHIHANSCADIGGVQYPLTFPMNGSSETMLEVSMDELQAGLPLSVNVHKSAEEVSVYVACGDIVL